ncbi:hypothetical protein ACIBEA_41795 [Streptomyces sp. NPDC051555]|uniref:hypothetical protein n=1 Tax=Streptomyces sp. NPDC051555 TaxID=3365657 RepID=UPI0037BD0660
MYSLNPGHRLPALQRGLTNAESAATKAVLGVGGILSASTLITPPPVWSWGVLGAAAAVVGVAPGPRSIARWAAVGYRHLTERGTPDSLTAQAGEVATWALYPEHGTMQDPHRRAEWHAAFGRALAYAGAQARTDGIQILATHHADVTDHTAHTQTLSVFVPHSVGGARILDRIEGQLAGLGVLTPVDPEPVPDLVERAPGWVALGDGEYAATARIVGWPDKADGDLMTRLLLGAAEDARSRSVSVMYRPLTPAQSRRSAKWGGALTAAILTDGVQKDAAELESESTHGELVQGAVMVDLDAYLTVWGDSPGDVMDARHQAQQLTDRLDLELDWLVGQQHRAHLMTTPHAVTTRKGATL